MRKDEADDTFQFEIVGKEETLILEASDCVDLRTWQRALHSSSRVNLRQSVMIIDVTHSGLLINSGRQDTMKNFYILSNYKLEWYAEDDDERKIPLGSIGIENCTFCDYYDPEKQYQDVKLMFLVCSPSQKDLCLTAESIEEKRMWLNQLKKSKLQYWNYPSNLTNISFDNRGFLWKIVGKRKHRRWFLLNNIYLLYFKT